MHIKKILSFLALVPISLAITSCGDDPSPDNQRKFYEQEEALTYRDVIRNGERQGYPAPSTGETRVLVVPIQFTDYPADEIGSLYNSEVSSSKPVKHYKEGSTTEPAGKGRGAEEAREDIRKVYFGEASETAWNSLSSYYQSSSYGKLKFNGIVTPWFDAFTDINTYKPVSTKEFKDGGGTAKSLASAILNYYSDEDMMFYKKLEKQDGTKFTSGKDFLQYFDSDSDGYVDVVEMVYSAPYYATYKNESGEDVNVDNEMFWAYCGGTTNDPNVNAPKLSKWAFQSYYTCVEGGTFEDGKWRAWTCEEISDGVAKVDAHTIVHETGHALGLADYYDYDYKKNPMGKADMMDNNVGDHSAYSKSVLGWTDPTVVTGPTTVTIKSFTKTGDCIIVPYRGYYSDNATNKNANTFNTEYLTLELYNNTGVNTADAETAYAGRYPKCPSKTGIKVFHVDSRLGIYDYSNSSGTFVQYTESIVSVSNSQMVTWGNSNTGSRTPKNSRGGSNWQIEYLTSKPNNVFTQINDDNLFHEGDTFGYDTYTNYTFNSDKAFGYKFVIDSLTDDSATITFYRA